MVRKVIVSDKRDVSDIILVIDKACIQVGTFSRYSHRAF